MQVHHQKKKALLAVLIGLACSQAQGVTLQEAASKAVLSNPDVLAKWHLFKASGSERDVSWGQYLPTLDLIFGKGNERRLDPNTTPFQTRRSYDLDERRASLRWNVFNGLGTTNDVARLDHAQLVRYYEFLDTSEATATEAVRAYIDVYRYRRLLEMAEENYAIHRLTQDKISERTRSGIGRAVDYDTATARLALAESNLLTETSNLHDVIARYQRLVGEIPSGEISPPPIQDWATALPQARSRAVEFALQNSPQLKAAVENILSAQRNVSVQKSGHIPQVDLYANASRTNSMNSTIGSSNYGSNNGTNKVDNIGATVSWNLFRGFQDQNRIEKALQEKFSAADTRERVCRDLRQNASIAFNDYLRLREQMVYLAQHESATDKAREALRKQFDIGQRSLLDVLDTENEYYTARRNHLNGQMDLATALLRYHGTSGKLLALLKINHLEVVPPKNPDTLIDEDVNSQCPPVAVPAAEVDMQAIFERAKAKEAANRSVTAVPSSPLTATAPAATPADLKWLTPGAQQNGWAVPATPPGQSPAPLTTNPTTSAQSTSEKTAGSRAVATAPTKVPRVSSSKSGATAPTSTPTAAPGWTPAR